MSATSGDLGANQRANPFPGLRPFREDEEHLFFGRENQVDAMVDRLAATRFLAVVGTSGCGKSSLVYCGLLPALHRGLLAGAGSAWRTAKMRPGGQPLRALATAPARPGVLLHDAAPGGVPLADIVDSTLRLSSLGLVDIVAQARLAAGTCLLLVVDQFEELFRYRIEGLDQEDAIAFVNLLLEARAETPGTIHIVLTMRSDFLGDCTRFPGLAEAINAGQYLVPRLTRDERRAAITGPVAVAGARSNPVLATRLVNDVGDNPDQLSILQHALNRTWARWQSEGGGELELVHYEAIGTMAHALDQHAERAYTELAGELPQHIAEKLFKALTDKAGDPRGVRRPTAFGTLCALCDATPAELAAVIEVFRRPSRSFLMPPAGDALDPETVVDISHESLMRVWERLKAWADEEALSAQHYRRLAEDAKLHAAGLTSLWRDPQLQLALDWRDQARPNEAWARRYHPGFAAAMKFLDSSRDEREAERQREAEQKQHEIDAERERVEARAHAESARTMRWAALVSSVLAAVALAFAALAWHKSALADNARLKAELKQAEADEARQKAEQALVKFNRVSTEKDELLQAATRGDPALAHRLQDRERPTVYIQVQSDEQRGLAERLQKDLQKRNYQAPGIELVKAGPRKAELRYFRGSERAQAETLASELREQDGLAELSARMVTGYEANSTPLQFELWWGPPPNSWFVIAGTYTAADNAKKTLEQLTAADFDARIISTKDYPNLRAGFFAAVLGPFASEAEADAARQKVTASVPDAYDAYVRSGW